jgi:hypothetical protein
VKGFFFALFEWLNLSWNRLHSLCTAPGVPVIVSLSANVFFILGIFVKLAPVASCDL